MFNISATEYARINFEKSIRELCPNANLNRENDGNYACAQWAWAWIAYMKGIMLGIDIATKKGN